MIFHAIDTETNPKSTRFILYISSAKKIAIETNVAHVALVPVPVPMAVDGAANEIDSFLFLFLTLVYMVVP